MKVYLDYAASSPIKEEVLEKMIPLLRNEYGNPESLHSYGRSIAGALVEARDRVAATLGVQPNEVYFTSGGTEADNWAVRCFGEGKLLYSVMEHAACLEAARLRKGGAESYPVLPTGIVDPDAIASRMTSDTGVVCLMAVNNETGCIQPLKEVREKIGRDALLFCDCVQAAHTQNLKEVLSVADAISLSAHKVGAAKGAGALIVKRGNLSPLIAGGEQERGKRGGTQNVASIVGFSYALEAAQRERERFLAYAEKLQTLFEKKVKGALGDEIRIDGENRAPNLTHITFRKGGGVLLTMLDLNGVAASGGAACSAHVPQPSHVLTAMGRSREEALNGIRFSYGEETTEEEVLFAADTVIACYKNLP